MIYMFMGVSGSGKSTVGKSFADLRNLPFFDGDDFHPEANVQKMSQNQALDDGDRVAWLSTLAKAMKECDAKGDAVFACSALKQKYRDSLNLESAVPITWVYLKGSYELIYERMAQRQNHFMSEKMLRSQFDTLEEPLDAIELDLSLSVEVMLEDLEIRLVQK